MFDVTVTPDVDVDDPISQSLPLLIDTPDVWDDYGWLFPETPTDLGDLLREALEAERVGDPWYYSRFWQEQFLPFNCGAAITRAILTSLGFEISEGEVTETAMRLGLLGEEGMTLAGIGQLFEHYEVETRTVVDGNMDLVRQELEAGNRVIGLVDAEELWANTPLRNCGR